MNSSLRGLLDREEEPGEIAEDVDVVRGLKGELEGQRHVMVLQHRLVVVQQRQRLSCVDQKGVPSACNPLPYALISVRERGHTSRCVTRSL